jgi:hypothetical protein
MRMGSETDLRPIAKQPQGCYCANMERRSIDQPRSASNPYQVAEKLGFDNSLSEGLVVIVPNPACDRSTSVGHC